MTKFIELGLSEPLALALKEIGYTEPTEIQSRAIPELLSGRDIMASAQTGSGKTAAYALPVIERLQSPSRKPRALVLAPTRELALQVEKQFTLFGKYCRLRTVTVYGGTGYDAQIKSLRRGVDVIVATPGRLLDHIENKTADLSGIEILILDEADRMLDMGFMPQVRKVMERLPQKHQTLMFSATIDSRVEEIANKYLVKPVTVRVNQSQVEAKEIEQRIYHVDEFGKDSLLVKLVQEPDMASVLIFTRTKRRATWVTNRLRASQVLAEEIHGDISQNKRENTLNKFRKGKFKVLVATDVAARGLDIPAISHVINYDLPDAPEDYVHRIGRTGRAGRSGVALSFVSMEQRHLIRSIERRIGRVLDPDSQIRKTLPPRRFRPSRRRII